MSGLLEQQTFNHGHLSGRSARSSSVDEVLEAHYDVIFTGTSWDSRCLVLSGTSIKAERAVAFKPTNVGKGELRAEHDRILREWLVGAAGSCEWVSTAAEDLAGGYSQIRDALMRIRQEVDRPLRMLVDLSATARYFTLAAVAIGLNDGFAEFVDVLYAEGVYGSVVSEEVVPRTGSTWDAVAIPALEGNWSPLNVRHLLITAGFAGDQAARLAERWDPDEVTVLLPKPGLEPGYDRVMSERNQAWMSRFGVDSDHVLESGPTDAIAAWKTVAQSDVVLPHEQNVYCLLTGSKPHALAMAVWAMAETTPAVLYVKPTVHQEEMISPRGEFWCYRFWDRTTIGIQ